jgi:menaquinone-dependent protoporphyrinogen oxidase
MRALIAYASAHGSTAQVAHVIAGVVGRQGIAHDVAAAGAVQAGAHYDAYVLGSAVRNGLWLPEMASLARRLRGELANTPFYLWLNCLRVVEEGGFLHVMQNYVPAMLAGLPKPRRVAVFGGRFDSAQLKPDESWILSFRYDGADLPARLAGDHRDWSAIEAWANEVAAALNALAAY